MQPRGEKTRKVPKLRRPPFAPAMTRSAIKPRDSSYSDRWTQSEAFPVHSSREGYTVSNQNTDRGGFQTSGAVGREDNAETLILVFDTSNLLTMAVGVTLSVVFVCVLIFILPRLKKRRVATQSESRYGEFCVKT